MAKQQMYQVRCTDGSVENYSYYDIFETVKSYLSQKGLFPNAADVDREIPGFLARMKKIVKPEESQEPIEA